MITIEQIAEKVIERIKAFPSSALFSQADVGPKTTWDEYKENYQHEEYEFFDFELYHETINGMIEDEMEELSSEDIDAIFYSFNDHKHITDRGEIHQEVEKKIFDYIHDIALSEDIEYNSPLDKYIKFYEDDYSEDGVLVAAEVLKKIGPEEYLFQIFSRETSLDGEQEIQDLTYLKQDCGLEQITFEEFEEIKMSFSQKQGETTKVTEQKKDRESYLDKLAPQTIKRTKELRANREAIKNNFKRLAELQKERELRLKELSDEMDKEGVPMEERPARFQHIYDEMVESSNHDPYHVDKLELWKLRNEELLKSKVDAVIAAKMASKGLTHLEAMRELQKELDVILKAERKSQRD